MDAEEEMVLGVDPATIFGLRSAARYCDVSPNTVRNWMLTGRLSFQEGNGRYFIAQKDLDEIKSQRAADSAEAEQTVRG